LRRQRGGDPVQPGVDHRIAEPAPGLDDRANDGRKARRTHRETRALDESLPERLEENLAGAEDAAGGVDIDRCAIREELSGRADREESEVASGAGCDAPRRFVARLGEGDDRRRRGS
jgi:hypothetical protein